MTMKIPKPIATMELYAWVGEDEFGSGEYGIKQGFVPAGLVPLVTVHKEKIKTKDLLIQSAKMVRVYNKPRYLCKFTFSAVETILTDEEALN